MTDTAAVTWHHGYVLPDGTPYPMRHQLSDDARKAPVLGAQVLGLSRTDHRTSVAVHELAHAVLWLAFGVPVVSVGVGLGRGGLAECDQPAPENRLGWAIGVAAGERAEDRWLRATGLWTQDLAANAELGARADRAEILAATRPRPAFGTGGPDFAEFHDMADQALETHWGRVMAALPCLLDAGCMTGDELATVTGLPNRARAVSDT